MRIGRLTGVDLSMAMMQALQAKIAGSALRLDLARADVVRLPFPDNRFDVIYAAHVLHLVNGWREAVNEARRTLRPGGCLVVSWHRRVADSPNVLLRKELHRLAEQHGVNTKRPGAQSEDEILDELRNWDEQVRVVNVADWTEPSMPAQIIADLDRQIFSETWMIPREVLDAVIPVLRVWAREKYGSLDREIFSPHNFRWLIVSKS